jgi:hypothetical protein
MPIFRPFLSPQVDVPDKVLDEAGKRLKRYFDAICRAMNPQKFSISIAMSMGSESRLGCRPSCGF